MSKAKDKIIKLLELADVKINGDRPWDIQVHNEKLYRRVLAQGSLGLGETYMDGWWDCEQIDVMIDKVISSDLHKKVRGLPLIVEVAFAKFFNLQTRKRAWQVGREHYDLGNDLYKIMLDKRMNYSCGYWRQADNLDQAQEDKLKLCCDKLKLQPGMKVLDIGCGWGAFAKYAAENYGVKVLGVTISKEQAELAKQNCAGLDVEIRLQDYRNLTGKFDAIISIGMFEHVGYKNYREYMKKVNELLTDKGLKLLHTIGGNTNVYHGDAWMDKYIFPNGMLPSPRQITKSINKLFVLEDWHNFGAYYDKTLMAWYENFKQGWPELKDKYGDRFYRMWTFYLLSCAGSFRCRKNQLWQVVLSKNGIRGGYKSVR